MHTRLLWLTAAATLTCALPAAAHDHSHSLESDKFEERLEGPQAREQAAVRV